MKLDTREQYVVLGPQRELLFCRNAEEARNFEARVLEARKRGAKPAKCPTCGRLIDDEGLEDELEEDGDARG